MPIAAGLSLNIKTNQNSSPGLAWSAGHPRRPRIRTSSARVRFAPHLGQKNYFSLKQINDILTCGCKQIHEARLFKVEYKI